MKKYIIYPGYVESKNDNEMHHIDADKLIELYRIKHSECIIIRNEKDKNGIMESNFIQLFPLRNGNYKEYIEYLLEEKQEMCKNCEHKENKRDSKILCTLHEEEYKDDKQVIFCSAKNK
jgi:hypothetical protein